MKGYLANTVRKPFKIRLKKGDTVVVRSGKYKGKTGKITTVHPLENKVTVEGINIVKKHVKPSTKYPQGGIIELTKPIWVSKVSILEPTAPRHAREMFGVLSDQSLYTFIGDDPPKDADELSRRYEAAAPRCSGPPCSPATCATALATIRSTGKTSSGACARGRTATPRCSVPRRMPSIDIA